VAVAFETRGHTYFVEDGLESKNIITGNLAAVTRELFVGLGTDATPASYWLVNGDNYVANNVAAGSSHCALNLTARVDPACSDSTLLVLMLAQMASGFFRKAKCVVPPNSRRVHRWCVRRAYRLL
jgi:hypothetical protein